MDFSYLDAVSDGDVSFIQQFVETFESTTKSLISTMKESLETEDFDKIRGAAHQLKPSLEMLKLETYSFCLQLNDDPSSANLEMLEKIEKDSLKAVAELKEHFSL